MIIKALIVDDEPPALRKLRRFLEVDPVMRIVGEAGNGREAIDAIAELTPDVVFLDVQMPHIDGFGVLEAFAGDDLPEIVFVTAHDRYAIRAFEVAALDYLLKPFDAPRLQATLDRVKERVRAGSDGRTQRRYSELLTHMDRSTSAAQRVLVKDRSRTVLLRVEDIHWIQAAGNYVEIHVEGAKHMMRESLDGIASRLAPDQFLRIHRSFLVNVESIQEIRALSHGDQLVVMSDGAELRLSRRFRENIPASLLRKG